MHGATDTRGGLHSRVRLPIAAILPCRRPSSNRSQCRLIPYSVNLLLLEYYGPACMRIKGSPSELYDSVPPPRNMTLDVYYTIKLATLSALSAFALNLAEYVRSVPPGYPYLVICDLFSDSSYIRQSCVRDGTRDTFQTPPRFRLTQWRTTILRGASATTSGGA